MTKRSYLVIGIMVLAVAFIALGVSMGQPGEVLTKAVNICLECVGLG